MTTNISISLLITEQLDGSYDSLSTTTLDKIVAVVAKTLELEAIDAFNQGKYEASKVQEKEMNEKTTLRWAIIHGEKVLQQLVGKEWENVPIVNPAFEHSLEKYLKNEGHHAGIAEQGERHATGNET